MADAPLRPLEVFAIDEDMNRASGTIPYTSLTWSRRYHECGQFSMVVPANVYDPSWAYVYAYARPETGIVQKVEYSDTAHTPDGIDTVTVSGFFLECFLNRLTFLVEQPEEQTIEIHVPEPKPAGIVKSQLPTVYRDPDTDEYFYTNSAGDLVDESGNRVDGSSDWEEVHSRLYGISHNTEGHWATQPNDHIASNFNFYTNEDKSQVTLVSWFGKETTQDVKFSDDKGNAFFGGGTTPDGEHYIYLANSCAYASAAEGYYTAKRAWDASGGVRYETITVKGPWQRTDTMEPITESDSVDQLFKWLQTFFGSTFKYEEPTFEGVVKTLDPSLQRMGDFAYSVLQEVGASLRVVYGFENDTLVLEAYKGKDRTQEQTELPWTVFSDTWGTIYDYSASRDTSNYRNTCYVLYSYDQPKSFDADGTPHLTTITNEDGTTAGWRVDYETKRGYQVASVKDDSGDEPDLECYLDLRESGGAPACDSEWSRDEYAYDESEPNNGKPTLTACKTQYDEWPDALTAKGVAELQQNYGVVTNLDTGTVVTSGYMTDWDLGDVVEFGVSTVGLMSQARIIGVDEVYESGRADIRIEVGDELLTDMQKAKLN